ncbi:hypothetical protein [Roseobacter litoralis]|uniref:hypothetical protein n=1 Tax=Roseobacter litoralis TaxID=42443 RepID=UPI002493914D|nr:hypothetical protein [Roseobacter litoralis]
MKKSEEGDPNRNTGGLFNARPTGRGTQVAFEVADMPKELASLLDKGIEDHFHDR